jgi:primosomal protein N' (replication factor Y)
MTEYFIDVLLPIPLEKLFTYRISKTEAARLEPGMRVAVPFGKSKIYTGIVDHVHQQRPEVYEAKEIHQILDDNPTVNTLQLRHWKWIAGYYMCTPGEVFRAAVPGAILLESETIIVKNREAAVDEQGLEDDEFLIFEALEHQDSLSVQDVSEIVDRKHVLQLLNRLLQKGVIRIREVLQEQYKPKMVPYVRIGPSYVEEEALEALLQQLSRAPKQRQALLTLFQLQAQTGSPVKLETLEKESGTTRAVIRALADKDILEEFTVQTDRANFGEGSETSPSKKLNPIQTDALAQIREYFVENKVTLLHGVTASGKTEIYVKLIEEFLEQDKQVLYLLPEIALTTQLIERLRAYFGDRITVYHSRYSLPERVEAWNNVLSGNRKAQVVIGARSALFLPFSRLGLILVDEEHENTFKQYDPAPRYHARDAAIVLASMHSARVLLGSATPSLESYQNAILGKYGLVLLERRHGNILMPEIALVDLKEQWRKKRMKGHFSEPLQEALATALKAGEQVILFQNRRGFAPIVECTSCGHSPQCPNCDVSLTYHQFKNELRCHYCGHHLPLPQSCPACGNATLDTRGFGTEQVEREVQELFPAAITGRMDLDTTRGKHGFSKIIDAFEQGSIDVLVGTQMVTKGLDFRKVSLVGIMNADSLLNFPDFRAHERCFQLLTQVAGRAGRTRERGRVLVQTYNPHHQILQQVTMGDYKGMFKEQLYEREQYHYPPVNRIIRITFKHKDYNKVGEAAAWFGQALRNVFDTGVLGPEFPPVSRIRNQYIKNILLKIARGQSPNKTKNSIKRIEKSFNAISMFKSVRVIYNVDYL